MAKEEGAWEDLTICELDNMKLTAERSTCLHLPNRQGETFVNYWKNHLHQTTLTNCLEQTIIDNLTIINEETLTSRKVLIPNMQYVKNGVKELLQIANHFVEQNKTWTNTVPRESVIRIAFVVRLDVTPIPIIIDIYTTCTQIIMPSSFISSNAVVLSSPPADFSAAASSGITIHNTVG